MVYFLSDAHLGSRVIAEPEKHQQRIVNLLQSISKDADAIYLLGDIFDFWYEYFYHFRRNTLPRSKKQYTPIIQCLKDIHDKGIEVHYFIGNHDIWTFGLIARLTGAVVHRQPEYAHIYGKTLYLAHGDGLIPPDLIGSLPADFQKRVRAFIRLRKFFHHPLPQNIYRLLPPLLGDSFGYEWARRSRLKELQHPCPYKGKDKEELVLYGKYLEEQAADNNGRHADLYVFGHRHIPVEERITDNSEVIILGDCFKQFYYAALSDDGTMKLQTF